MDTTSDFGVNVRFYWDEASFMYWTEERNVTEITYKDGRIELDSAYSNGGGVYELEHIVLIVVTPEQKFRSKAYDCMSRK